MTAQGAYVTRATSTREALAAVRAKTPDVILTDLSMPGDDGFTLLSQLRSDERVTTPGMRIVAITAHARPEDREKCLAAGFDAYVPKPLDLNHIIDVVADLTANADHATRQQP